MSLIDGDWLLLLLLSSSTSVARGLRSTCRGCERFSTSIGPSRNSSCSSFLFFLILSVLLSCRSSHSSYNKQEKKKRKEIHRRREEKLMHAYRFGNERTSGSTFSSSLGEQRINHLISKSFTNSLCMAGTGFDEFAVMRALVIWSPENKNTKNSFPLAS